MRVLGLKWRFFGVCRVDFRLKTVFFGEKMVFLWIKKGDFVDKKMAFLWIKKMAFLWIKKWHFL
jgi:hypothetical protein